MSVRCHKRTSANGAATWPYQPRVAGISNRAFTFLVWLGTHSFCHRASSIAGGAYIGGRDTTFLPAEIPDDVVADRGDLRVGIGGGERRHQVVAPG
jgi:hypothetical protein